MFNNLNKEMLIMLKKILVILVMVVMISTPVSAELIVHAGTEVTEDLEILDVEKDTYKIGEKVYVLAYQPYGTFGQDYLEVTLIDTSGLGESILERIDMEIDSEWDVAGLPLTLNPGEYRIKFASYEDSGSVRLNIVE
jgi:hypothetical protein